MKILITHAYARDNKGDAAILSVLLMQLQEAFHNPEITISIFDKTRKIDTFEGYPLISNYMFFCLFTYRNALLKMLYSIYVISITMLWALLYVITSRNVMYIIPAKLKRETREFLESDLIVPIGGGYLRAKKGIMETINLWFVLHPIIIASLLKKPIVLYSQTIGPLATPFQKYITRVVLNRTACIMVREDKTLNLLQKIGVKMDLVVRAVDAGFLFRAAKKIPLSEYIGISQKTRQTMVGITVRNWLDTKKQAQYELEIASFINKIIKDPAITILFIPQVSSEFHGDDDRKVAERVIQHIHSKEQIINITKIYDHHEIKELYGKLDYLIGTRFHSVIFALTSSVPSLAIEYEYKTSGIMHDLGLSEWVILIEEVTSDRLDTMFQLLIKNRTHYLAVLDTTLPVYIKKAKENVQHFKNVYTKRAKIQ